MKHVLLLGENNLSNNSGDMLKNINKYESAVVKAFSNIKKIKNLQKAKNDDNILDADFYNNYYKGVYYASYYEFLDTYKNLLFNAPKEQTIPICIAVHYFKTEGHRKGSDSYAEKYWVNLLAITEDNFKIENKVYQIEDVENLINNGQIFVSNWRTGKVATQEEYEKHNFYSKLNTLYFDNQKQFNASQDFSELPFYTHSYNIIRKTLTTGQVNEDLSRFIKKFEEPVKTILEKNEKEKEISIKRHYVRKLKLSEDIINISNNALGSLNALEKE